MLSLQMLLSKCGRRRGDEMELLLVIYFSATKAEQITIFFLLPFHSVIHYFLHCLDYSSKCQFLHILLTVNFI